VTGQFVYRSRDPEVVQGWKDAGDAIHAYVDETKRVLANHGAGGYQDYRHGGGWSIGRFSGLLIPQDEFPPPGWRMADAAQMRAVPDKRTKAGKAVTATLEAVKHPGDPLFKLVGMPPDIAGGPGFITPSVRLLEDRAALYVAWRENPEGRESFFGKGSAIDFGKWERVKLSEYYTEVERADAAKADAEVSA
jgi:hypothetical protein